MAGKRPTEDPLKLKEILASVEIFKDGKILPPSSSIWSQLINLHLLKISPKALYTFALRTYGKKIIKKLSIPTSPSSSSNSSGTDFRQNQKVGSNYFDIILTGEDWAKIKPELKEYSRDRKGKYTKRQYYRFRSGVWTDIVALSVWKKQSCPVFGNLKVIFWL